MDKLVVRGGRSLEGRVTVSGAKNAILPIMAASLLAGDEVVINSVPMLDDVKTNIEVLTAIGAGIRVEGERMRITPPEDPAPEAPYDLIRRMRASFLVLGPLLARIGEARIAMPGGCAIGSRPIDLHLKGLAALGASIRIGHGCVEARAGSLAGSHIYLDYPSVGATENVMMSAVLARGETIIENAAEEPEVVDLANFLNAMGGRITGAGTNVIRIQGVRELHGAEHTPIPDRIEAGTFMVMAAVSRGDIRIDNVMTDHLKPVIAKLRETGCWIQEDDGLVYVRSSRRAKAVDVKTLPYPGFPTDMQAQMMALLATAEGTSLITETVFENRFMHVDELKRMGADIKIEGFSAVVKGKDTLTGAPVKATDLRAGAALVVAALAAEGETEISGLHHIDRGYADFEKKLKELGAEIQRVPDERNYL